MNGIYMNERHMYAYVDTQVCIYVSMYGYIDMRHSSPLQFYDQYTHRHTVHVNLTVVVGIVDAITSIMIIMIILACARCCTLVRCEVTIVIPYQPLFQSFSLPHVHRVCA